MGVKYNYTRHTHHKLLVCIAISKAHLILNKKRLWFKYMYMCTHIMLMLMYMYMYMQYPLYSKDIVYTHFILLTASRWSWTWGDIRNPLICFIKSTNSSAGIVPDAFLSCSLNAWRACSVGRFCELRKSRRKRRRRRRRRKEKKEEEEKRRRRTIKHIDTIKRLTKQDISKNHSKIMYTWFMKAIFRNCSKTMYSRFTKCINTVRKLVPQLCW